jgi:hypothetical protein
MTDRETAVLAIIKRRKGSANAITARDIGSVVETHPREVRRITTRLIVVFGHPIYSAGGRTPGYFYAKSARELSANVDRLMRHAKIEIIHAVRLQPARHVELIGQISVDLAGEIPNAIS